MALPNVDVVIPVYNKSSLVLRLLSSLRSQKRLGQIVIVDDSSSEIDQAVLETVENVKLLRNVGNSGFVKSVNRGFKRTESEYVLILNSDTEAYHNHCVEYMAENIDDGAAVCGALLVYPKSDPYQRGDLIQHCGVFFDTRGYPRHIMSGFPADTPMANVRRSVPAVTGACFMTTKKWWNSISGFDTRLSPGCFEDVDFCIQARKLGGDVIYDPRSIFYHYEHASQTNSSNWFSDDNLGRNFQYLLLKHGQQPASDSYWFKGLS
jgi:GT2 family glycosyltransferase